VKGQSKPRTLNEFGCWLNCWADLEHMPHRAKFEQGYERAVSDILRVFEELHPDWIVDWMKYTKRSRSEADKASA
jgi:hypothetical protein